MKIILTALIFTLLINTASAELYVSDFQGSSYPNPSIEGQKVTFTSTVMLKDSDTGEIFPANGGYIAYFLPWGRPQQTVTDGVVTNTASDLPVGTSDIGVVYFWTSQGISDKDIYINQEVKPYVKGFQVSSSKNPSIEGESVTFTAKFDFEQSDDPNYVPPRVHITFDDISLNAYETDVPENGIVTWTVPSLTSGTYDINVWYDTYIGDKESSYGETVYTQQVNEEEGYVNFDLSVTLADQGKFPVLSTGTTDTYIVHAGQPIDINFHVDPAISENGYYGDVNGYFESPDGQVIYVLPIMTPIDSNGDASLTITEPIDPGRYIFHADYEDFDEIRGCYTEVYVNIIDSNSPSLPEFPTIAMPLAAILGLLVIAGRKKSN